MRALVLDEGVRFDEAYPDPTPLDGDVLVEVRRAGVCETDLQLVRGYMGFRGVLGHEFVGVARSGPWAGQRVVGEINCSCGVCDTCRAGRPSHCPDRTVVGIRKRDGAFADFICLPQRNLHRVPDSLPDEVAVFTEPVAAACRIPTQIDVRRDDRIVVLGDGRLGNLCAQVLARLSSHVLVVGKHEAKLARLRAVGLATARVSDVSRERVADIVVDCTGSETGLPTALELVRPRGTIVLKTTVAGTQTMPWAPLVVDEVTLVGSRCGPFDRALEALESGAVDVRGLVTHRLPLARGAEALEIAASASALKVLLEIA
ncbi:MAG: alcohol dehydrogenase catalytic domain-containing protein [Vicinamibacterales bacterium]